MKIIITEKKMSELSKGWKVKKGKLFKKFEFDNFDQVMKFVNNVAKIAKKQNHHPDIKITYNLVELTMFDHDKNKISDKCYKFVDSVNDLE